MTVVAYKDGVLASDSLIQAGGMRSGSATKIIKTRDGFLAGGAGEMGKMVRFLRWADGDKSEPTEDLEGFEGILVYPDGRVISYDGTGEPLDIKSEFYALGTGSDIAIGVMEMGGTPQQAVKAAIKWSTGCGGKVQVVKL